MTVLGLGVPVARNRMCNHSAAFAGAWFAWPEARQGSEHVHHAQCFFLSTWAPPSLPNPG